jgi:hypothetical protein
MECLTCPCSFTVACFRDILVFAILLCNLVLTILVFSNVTSEKFELPDESGALTAALHSVVNYLSAYSPDEPGNIIPRFIDLSHDPSKPFEIQQRRFDGSPCNGKAADDFCVYGEPSLSSPDHCNMCCSHLTKLGSCFEPSGCRCYMNDQVVLD